MRHLTVQPAEPLRRGRKIMGPFRDFTVLAIVARLGPVCRAEIADEYEWLTGEWLGPKSLYYNISKLSRLGLIRRVPPRHVAVLREDVDRPPKRPHYYEVTPRGDRSMDAAGRVVAALSRASSHRRSA